MRVRAYTPSICELAFDSAADIDVVLRDGLCYLGVLWYLERTLQREFNPKDPNDFGFNEMRYHDELVQLHEYWRKTEPKNLEGVRTILLEVTALIKSTYSNNYNRKVDEDQLRKCFKLCMFITKTWPLYEKSSMPHQLVA